MGKTGVYGSGNIILALALLLTPAGTGYSAFPDQGGGGLELAVMERLTRDPLLPPVAFMIRQSMAAADPLALGNGPEEVGAWQIQILDRAGRKVSFIQGRNEPPRTVLTWEGTSPAGEPLPDGFYHARLVWSGPGGEPRATPKTLITLSTPQEIRSLFNRKLRFRYTEEGLVIGIAERMIFRPGRSMIQPDALPALREISVFLRSNPGKKAIVRGYTDSSGSPRRNLSLSRERAVRVYRYLVDAGIESARLAYSGMGAADPLADNATEAGRSANRRVEVVVLKTAL